MKLRPNQKHLAEEENIIEVIYFQRKPRPSFNFSIENFFDGLRNNLHGKIIARTNLCSFYNDGIFTKFLNIIKAAVRQKRNAITHITGEVHFLNLLMRKQQVLLTIHDCRFMERKKGIQKWIMNWLYLKAPIKKAKIVTAVSENTKKEIIQYTTCNPDKITVIPVSVDPIFQPVPKNFNKNCPVILQIGTAANKNIERLIQAITNVHCKLIVIGNLSAHQLQLLNKYAVNFQVKFNLSQADLYKSYVDCDIVSFVSTYEGFGMPIIEANCVERAVITSNISSMPEIAGNAACLTDPFNVEAIRNCIKKIIEDDAYRNLLIENGRTNKKRFNIKHIANSYYNLYKEMI